MQQLTRYIPRWFAVMVALSMLVTLVGLNQIEQVHPQQRLADVIWVDHVPEDPSESFKACYFGVDNYGVMLDAPTCYKLVFEIFEFTQSKKKLSYTLPHSGKSHSSAYSIEKLDPPTEYFDTQLTIKKDPNNGYKQGVYFTGPEFRSHQTLPPVVKEALERQRLRLVN